MIGFLDFSLKWEGFVIAKLLKVSVSDFHLVEVIDWRHWRRMHLREKMLKWRRKQTKYGWAKSK